MKLQILSDLHIDSYINRMLPKGSIPKTDADIILVAGDTSNSDLGMRWLQQQAEINDKPIITIAGNHEYFSEDILTFDRKLAAWDNFDKDSNSGLRFLQCSSIDIGDLRILGCTLWTDYQYQASEQTFEAAMAFMRDYRQIYAGELMFSPAISMQIHAEHRQWLKEALMTAKAQNKQVVAMTHHSVSPLSVSAKYTGFPSNAAFVTDLSEWMHTDWAPSLWIHGHTHEAFDYKLGNTHVVANPRAYPGEVSSTKLEFDWAKVVEI